MNHKSTTSVPCSYTMTWSAIVNTKGALVSLQTSRINQVCIARARDGSSRIMGEKLGTGMGQRRQQSEASGATIQRKENRPQRHQSISGQGPKAQNKLGSIRKKHKALVSLFSVANIKGAKHDHTLWWAFEQVYVLSGMNECLTDPLLPAGNGHFHVKGGLATAVSIRSLGNGLTGSIQRLVKVKIHGPSLWNCCRRML